MKDGTFALTLGGIAFLLTVIWGGPLITLLRRFKIGKQIRIELPESHQVKMGTPTMGGLMIVFPVLGITVVLNAVSLLRGTGAGRSVLLPLAAMVAFTVMGAWDDWLGLSGVRRGEGMRGRAILFWQGLIALFTALGLYFPLGIHVMFLPGIPFPFDLGWLYIPVVMFVMVGMSNAVNITDGMDGLCGLISATAFAAYGIIALLQGQIFLTRFCFTVVGALVAFLWFKRP
jgi:phospho-N-acetylmuramoyl-pentapeptide-transferase